MRGRGIGEEKERGRARGGLEMRYKIKVMFSRTSNIGEVVLFHACSRLPGLHSPCVERVRPGTEANTESCCGDEGILVLN